MGLVGSGAAERKETNSYQPLRLRTGGATWGLLPTTYMIHVKILLQLFQDFSKLSSSEVVGVWLTHSSFSTNLGMQYAFSQMDATHVQILPDSL